jgi:pilus assembly protein CpaC
MPSLRTTSLVLFLSLGKPATAASDSGTSTASTAQALVMSAGEHRVLEFKGMQRVAIGDTRVADVKTLGADRLEVQGLARGKTTLLVWTEGDRTAVSIQVR